MADTDTSKRGTLVRNSFVFQLKLMADGIRDLVLLPVSLIATVIGLLRGGDEPEREFLQVIQIGRESEKWINLFGTHDAPENATAIASIDTLFTKLEDTLKQQYLTSGISQKVQVEIDEALRAAQDQAKQEQAGEEQAGEGQAGEEQAEK
jgi:hypothetical protein